MGQLCGKECSQDTASLCRLVKLQLRHLPALVLGLFHEQGHLVVSLVAPSTWRTLSTRSVVMPWGGKWWEENWGPGSPGRGVQQGGVWIPHSPFTDKERIEEQ